MDPSKQYNNRTILDDRIFDYRTKITFLFICTRAGCNHFYPSPDILSCFRFKGAQQSGGD